MFSPCLSTAGIRFLQHPVPTEELALPYGWVTNGYFPIDLTGVTLFRMSQIRQGWKPTALRGLGVREGEYLIPLSSWLEGTSFHSPDL